MQKYATAACVEKDFCVLAFFLGWVYPPTNIVAKEAYQHASAYCARTRRDKVLKRGLEGESKNVERPRQTSAYVIQCVSAP